MNSFRILSILCCFWVTITDAQTPSAPVIIKAAHLLDVVQGKVIDNAMVRIEGERIKAVDAGLRCPGSCGRG